MYFLLFRREKAVLSVRKEKKNTWEGSYTRPKFPDPPQQSEREWTGSAAQHELQRRDRNGTAKLDSQFGRKAGTARGWFAGARSMETGTLLLSQPIPRGLQDRTGAPLRAARRKQRPGHCTSRPDQLLSAPGHGPRLTDPRRRSAYQDATGTPAPPQPAPRPQETAPPTPRASGAPPTSRSRGVPHPPCPRSASTYLQSPWCACHGPHQLDGGGGGRAWARRMRRGRQREGRGRPALAGGGARRGAAGGAGRRRGPERRGRGQRRKWNLPGPPPPPARDTAPTPPRPHPAAPTEPRAGIQNRCLVGRARAPAPETGRRRTEHVRAARPARPGLPEAQEQGGGVRSSGICNSPSRRRRGVGKEVVRTMDRSRLRPGLKDSHSVAPSVSVIWRSVLFLFCFSWNGLIVALYLRCGMERQLVGKQQTGERDPEDSSFSPSSPRLSPPLSPSLSLSLNTHTGTRTLHPLASLLIKLATTLSFVFPLEVRIGICLHIINTHLGPYKSKNQTNVLTKGLKSMSHAGF